MRKVAAALAYALLLVRLLPAQDQDRDSRVLFNEMPKILAILSDITGWKNPKPVPADIITLDQLHRFIVDRMKEQMKPEDIRIEDLTLKMFGLVPRDFDLQKATVDLLTEQAAAFYDYNKKRLFILETQSSLAEKRIALVHELAHALADQNVSLKKYIRQGSSSDDGETAREAVMEGQATWLMWAYTSKIGGGAGEPPDMALKLLGSASQAAETQYPVFANAPLYMRESLIFPYTSGL
ncbi:MAG: ImmA/IrrE family metallo-endopeptidase, partial [Bryobacteraceae bacterium]